MNAIVVTDKQWAIGRSGDLLFSLPGDMKHFRTLTTGGTVIMGRKTLDSFPGGRAVAQAAEYRHHPVPGLSPGGLRDCLHAGGCAGAGRR